jgi:hypothetical protein
MTRTVFPVAFSAVPLFVLALGTLPAQGPPQPAPQLGKLKVLEGSWQGSGTAKMQPGAPATKWKANSQYQWVLGNFWLQCDTAVDFEGQVSMRFRDYMGWDGENQRYVSLAINSMGEVVLSPVHLGESEMVVFVHWMREGKPQVERARTKFTADKMDLSICYLNADGPSEEVVTGSLSKVAKVDVPALSKAAGMSPPAPEMARINKIVGVYDGAGEMIMMPGTPAMKISGRDTYTALFDGHVVMNETKGVSEGGPAYEAHGFMGWSAADNCYKLASIDNMGMLCVQNGRLTEDALICTFEGLRMGQPLAARCVVSLDKEGGPTKMVNHSCTGSAPPLQDFSMTFKRVKV